MHRLCIDTQTFTVSPHVVMFQILGISCSYMYMHFYAALVFAFTMCWSKENSLVLYIKLK